MSGSRRPSRSQRNKTDRSRARLQRLGGSYSCASESLEARMMLDSTVVFSELLYNHPTAANQEWIELYNQMGINMDLTGWRIDGGVSFAFPDGFVIPAGGYVVVAADPTALQAATGFAGALGPFTGTLDNAGEELELLNNSNRLMNSVNYGDKYPWPVAADGSGGSLAKRDPNAASEPAASWSISAQVGGTPGAVNFPTVNSAAVETSLIGIDDTWKYEASGTDLGTSWSGIGPNIDTSWSSGAGLLYSGSAHLQPTPGGLTGAGLGLYGYWPLEQTTGASATNSVAGGTAAALFNGVTWVNDAQRGRVLTFDGNNGYANAGTIPSLTPTSNFTWSFWAKQAQAAPPNRPNDVVLGNRYPDSGWIKFTPSSFEYRDIAPTFNHTIDTPDLAPAQGWVHLAVVKSGTQLTYYRNGIAVGTSIVTGTMPSIPLYFGGNTVDENWTGSLDDIAVWTKNLPAQAIAGLATGTYTPLTAPTAFDSGDTTPGALALSDDFTSDAVNTTKWTVTQQGLESTGGAGYNPPSTTASSDRLTLGGTTTAQYWFGSSLQSVASFRTDETITAQVDRVSLAGSGTAYRSSLWLYADSGHYLHFSQNIGEGGWSYNINDVGGVGSASATGGGINISAFDALDGNLGQHEMKLVYKPSGPGQGTIDIYLNGTLGASQTVTNWPSQFKVLTTGQARAIGDTVSAVFDNVKVFSKPPVAVPTITTSTQSDDFTANTINPANWTPIEYGLESRGAGTGTGYVLDTTTVDNRLSIAGTANVSYWGGGTLQSVQSYLTNVQTSVSVDRVSLSGAGTAYRSSLWLWADDDHYLHFSQNIGETGWSYNLNDVGGVGSASATGSGTAIANFNAIASDTGQHQMKLVYKPTGANSGVIDIYLDGTLGASQAVSNWPSQFKVMVTGQGRQAGDSVAAVFDNLSVVQSAPVTLATLLPLGPSTYYFRKEFTFDGDPARTTFELMPVVDDGAVFYLDGVEVFRYNMPEGPIDYSTLAAAETDAPLYAHPITISAASLVPGSTHVLAVEVHQATGGSPDMVFGTTLKSRVTPLPPTGAPPLAFNEVAPTTDVQFQLEIINQGTTGIDLTGYSIGSSTLNPDFALPTQILAPGGTLVVTEAQLGFHPLAGDRLFLFTPAKAAVLDGVSITNNLQARSSEFGGRFLRPSVATFGAPNTFAFQNNVVINEIMYNHRPTQTPVFAENDEQWIELYNRGATPVDLSGWDFGQGINFTFAPGTVIPAGGYLVVSNNAAALLAAFPGIHVVGDFTGSLSHGGETIELRDANNNPADIVSYFDEGRWNAQADGGGTSLELRNPAADNSHPESWAASNESARTQWQTYTYTGTAQNSNGDPTQYNEFIMGLLDAGEILIDDISVIQDPLGTPKQLIQNGSFSSGNADTWRLLGNHSHSPVIDDPANPGNKVLRLVATGPTEHMHNHAETTLKDGANYVTIQDGLTYTISFKAKVLSGSNQLNTRLYFNRLAQTTLLVTPTIMGTPGMQNSTFVANAGPSFSDLHHGPVTPLPLEPVVVSATASDSDGIASMTLWYAIDGGVWNSVPMTGGAGGVYSGAVPGQAASTIVQFYVQAEDAQGATSNFPAAGPDSRALFKVNDGQSQPGGLHDFRIIMLTADANLLHTVTNVMSNDRMGATVVYDDAHVYYDSGVRLKGSERGRSQSVRVGFNVSFDPTNLFRGVHESVAIDRSGAGNEFSQKEILIKHAIAAAGDIPGMYDDLIRVIAPQNQHTGTAMLQMARFGNEFLDTQYDNGSDGTAFEYELIYFPLTTTGGPEGLKIPEPDDVRGVGMQSLGPDKEKYRWHFLIENNRDQDDYSKLLPALSALGQGAGATFNQQTGQLLDVDQWLRAFAVQNLFGVGDNYATGSAHNAIFYTRPEDGKTLYFPFDMDFNFSNPVNTLVVQNGELSKLLGLGANVHHYYGHLYDIIQTTFNTTYMTPWVNYYDSLLPESFTAFNTYIADRSANVLTQINGAVAPVTFVITTNDGAGYNVATPTTTIAGDGWVDVRQIFIDGRPNPLDVTWTDKDSWQVTVPLASGDNVLTFRAIDFSGVERGSDTITVNSSFAPPTQDALRVTEIMYHPGNRTQAEIDAGFTNDDDFEFLEIQNTSSQTVDLNGVKIAGGVTFDFTGSDVTSLAPGEYVLVVTNLAAFATRYDTAGLHIAGVYGGQLSNGGEELQLINSLNLPIQTFTYDDIWYPSTDGPGESLVIIDPLGPIPSWNDAVSWRASANVNGSPGSLDPQPSSVVGRHVFYNSSKFDGNDAATGLADDAAIATDKVALLPGGNATFANYTSYSRGINGIMVDIDQLSGPLTLANFSFRVGNDNTPGGWAAAPAPLSLDVRTLAGQVSRATLVWADGAIKKQWLEVTVNVPGQATPDKFYFGNAVGESGEGGVAGLVNSSDEIGARNHPQTFLVPATAANVYDFNRDGFVNATDQILARGNSTTLANGLKLIAPPAAMQPQATTMDPMSVRTTESQGSGSSPAAAASFVADVSAGIVNRAQQVVASTLPVISVETPSAAVSTVFADLASEHDELVAVIFQGTSISDGESPDADDELYELIADDLLVALAQQ